LIKINLVSILKIQNISKRFQGKSALDDVSLEVKHGEIFGLLGPNGAGKTTLIRIINQIIHPDSGDIFFDNEPLKQRHLESIGYLPEERGLYRSMKVLDHLIFLGELRGLKKQEAKQKSEFWLNKMEISSWKNKRIEELSKGMAQKVQFIGTILHEPKLLILDEPLSGFDPINVELILSILKEMKSQGKTILLSTHNMKSVEEICDRAVIIHQSRKMCEGEVLNLRESIKKGQYALRFNGNMIAFVNALWTDFELIDKKELSSNRFEAIVAMRSSAEFEDLLKSLIGQVKLEAAWEVMPSMHDVFLSNVQSTQTTQTPNDEK
jgi:ABC-2 type transport system ATP-binding protein